MINPKECPAYHHGRWYEFFLESDNGIKITTSDLEGSYITGSNLAFPKNFHVVDFMMDINPVEIDTASNFNLTLHFFTDSQQGVAIPAANKFDWCRVYVFGYFSL